MNSCLLVNLKNAVRLALIASAFSLSLSLSLSGYLQAQVIDWRVVVANSANVSTPGIPAGSAPNVFRSGLSDAGQGNLLAQLDGNALTGRWVRRNGSFIRYAREDVSGIEGPNRTGAEADHVFRFFRLGDDDLGTDASVAFVGRAGPVGSVASSQLLGIWRWDGVRNNEIARAVTDGPLGPNLGANWFFSNSVLNSARVLNSGAVVFDTEVISPTAQVLRSVHQHLPVVGNTACLVLASTLPALSPNLGNGSTFESLRSTVILNGARVFALARTSSVSTLGTEEGVWRICSGAPVPVALTLRTGALGPNVGVSTAFFASINSNVRDGGGDLLFSADWQLAAFGAFESGIFRQRSGVNALIAKTNDTGALGPNWLGSRFSNYSAASLIGAGPFAAFAATARTPDNTFVSGIWRVRPDGNPAPVALVGVLGEFAPGPAQTFQSIGQWTLLANGDVIADAIVSGGTSGVFLFRIGQPPQLIFRIGQSIAVTTNSGVVQANVVSFSLPQPDNDGAQSSFAWAGVDSWAGLDGSLLVRATLNISGTNVNSFLTTTIDLDTLLRNGFEQ